MCEIDFHVTKIRAIQKKYGPRIKAVWLHEEDWVTLESLDPSLSVEGIIREFGLIPIKQYHLRCDKAQRARRAAAQSRQPSQRPG